MERTIIDVYQDLTLTCDYVYDEGYPETDSTPGTPPSVEIKAFFKEVNIDGKKRLIDVTDIVNAFDGDYVTTLEEELEKKVSNMNFEMAKGVYLE